MTRARSELLNGARISVCHLLSPSFIVSFLYCLLADARGPRSAGRRGRRHRAETGKRTHQGADQKPNIEGRTPGAQRVASVPGDAGFEEAQRAAGRPRRSHPTGNQDAGHQLWQTRRGDHALIPTNEGTARHAVTGQYAICSPLLQLTEPEPVGPASAEFDQHRFDQSPHRRCGGFA